MRASIFIGAIVIANSISDAQIDEHGVFLGIMAAVLLSMDMVEFLRKP